MNFTEPKIEVHQVLGHTFYKAELLLEGIFFALNFLPWEFLLVKMLEIEKTKTTKYTTFKTDNKSGLSFFDFQYF